MAHDPPFDFSSSPCSSPNIGPVDSSSPFSSPFPSPKKSAPLMLPDAAAMTMQTPRPRRPYFTSGQDHATPKFRPSVEESVWSGAIDFAVQEGNGFLNLAGRGLKEVSPEIIDLSKFFAISDVPISLLQNVSSSAAAAETATSMSNLNANTPNKRSRVTPPTLSTSNIHDDNAGNSNGPSLKPVRTFSRTITAGVPNHELRLDLSRNSITRLPRELFALTKLTVLLLRQNEIAYLPPEIGLLTSLRELNVANNKLRYLPAEILSLRLQTLSVQPNRFLTPPDDDDPSEEGDSGDRSEDGEKKKKRKKMKKYLSFSRIDSLFSPRSSQPVLGPIEYPSWQDAPGQLFPSAVELCARRLFAPSSTATTGQPDECNGDKGELSTTRTVLEETYALPLNAVHAATPLSPSPGPWPPPIVHMFAACVPRSIARPVATAAAEAAAAATSSQSASTEIDGTEVLGIGRCPNPRHRQKPAVMTTTTSMGSGVFVRHVEQRLEWRNEIAGRPVWSVPVLWRGCSSGCLDFLDEDEEEMRAAAAANDKATSSTGLPPFKRVVVDNDSSSDEGSGDREDNSDGIPPRSTPSLPSSSTSSLSLDQDVVRPVTLPSGPLDFDE